MKLARRTWRIITAACIAAPFAHANAQGTTAPTAAIVRGVVSDSANHQPVVGAQVIAVGTTRGAVTDTAGAYTLRVPPGVVTIRVQRIGYAPGQRDVTATLDGTATADFLLRAVSTVLSEVVVTGYGTQTRAQVTGAVTNVDGQDVQDQPVAGVDAALQGKAAGVQVSQNSGEPGTGISVRIRGAASLSASNQPLYVVDGVPIANDALAQQLFPAGSEAPTAITGLDPNEIESITVLKDAASAAIYGSRASNGVVMITTKRGQVGKAKFHIDLSTGIQNAATKLKLMNATQYVTYMNEGAVNDGDGIQFFAGIDDATSTDWQDAIFRTAPVQNLHAGVSGGSETLRYNVEGSFFKQQGIVLGSAYNRANARVNVDYDATPKFRLKTSIGLSRENNDRIEGNNSNDGIVTNAIGQPAVYHVKNPDGSFTSTADTTPSDNSEVYSNPVAIGTYDRLPEVTDHILGNVEGNYLFNSHFTLTGSAGVDILHDNENQWRSPLVVGNYAFGAHGVAQTTFDNTNHYLLQSYLTYQGGSDAGSSPDRCWRRKHRVQQRELELPSWRGVQQPGIPVRGERDQPRRLRRNTNREQPRVVLRPSELQLQESLSAPGKPASGRIIALRCEQPLGLLPRRLRRLGDLGGAVHGEFQQQIRPAEAARQLWQDGKSVDSELRVARDLRVGELRRDAGHRTARVCESESEVGEHQGVGCRHRLLPVRRPDQHHRGLLPQAHLRPARRAASSRARSATARSSTTSGTC